jgi:RNA polymerase sigma factor (sigma-70 family)
MPNEQQRTLTPDELFEQNQGLVYSYLKKNPTYIDSFEYEDLAQECMMALWKACEKFDSSKGIQFNTYALTCIRNHFTDLIRHNSKLIHPIITDPGAFDEVEIHKDCDGTLHCNNIEEENKYDEG